MRAQDSLGALQTQTVNLSVFHPIVPFVITLTKQLSTSFGILFIEKLFGPWTLKILP